ncbi:hypothetical protein [Ruegeria arenilitoris]|nr:hypothetical protein [Ruegeria arenilitoris]
MRRPARSDFSGGDFGIAVQGVARLGFLSGQHTISGAGMPQLHSAAA